jgi:tetratricopeptide (TPR) repeat protein
MAQEHITLALLHDLFTAPQPNAELVGRLLRLRSHEVPRRDELLSEFEQVGARHREIDYGAVIAAAAAKTVDVASRLGKERAGASAELRRLLRLLPAGRRRVLERATTRFRSPALVELLIEAARVALPDAPARAIELLTLAEQVTRRVPLAVYGPAFCNSLAVRALAHRANAVRVAGDLTAAAAQWRQIHARIATEPLGDVDAEAEVACLEASLRLDQGRFDRAERLLGRARRRYRAAKDPEGLAKTLIKLAIAKRVQGQPEVAMPLLREAQGLVSAAESPRLSFAVVGNLALCLCDLRRFTAAAALVDANRPLYETIHDQEAGLLWSRLQGRISRGLGEPEIAEQLFLAARDGYLARRQVFSAALVSLDLIELYLEQGRTAEVKRLAAAISEIFAAQEVHDELARALTLFQQAAGAERLTLQLFARLRTPLERAERNLRQRLEPVDR